MGTFFVNNYSVSTGSLRSLLYVEWLLLFVTASIEIILHLFNPERPAPWLIVGVNLGFALLGLLGRAISPNPRTAGWQKIGLTILEFGLIAIAGNIIGRRSSNFVAMLCTIAVIRACLRFGQRGRSIVTGLAIVTFLGVLLTRPDRRWRVRFPDSQIFFYEQLTTKFYVALSFGLTLLVILLLVNTLLAERQSRQTLDAVNQQLRRYALQIEDQATLQERSRIAREIHDALGHTLMAQSILLQNTKVFLASDVEQAQEFLAESIELGAQALRDVRQSVATLRTNPLKSVGLEPAISQLVENFQQTNGLQPSYNIQLQRALPAEVSLALYRIVQEALTNIQKHAQASQVKIEILASREQVNLLIEDNGRGCDLNDKTTGFGLQGMQERTQNLAGNFQITSQVGTGCRIMAEIPLLGFDS
jgi:signal transduction histidine kinase